MQDKVYGQTETHNEILARVKTRANLKVAIRKRAKQIKRKRRLQNKYCLTR